MKLSQLYRQGNRLLATDGQMYIDQRLNIDNAKEAVKQRNERFEKNFPNKLADAFEFKGNVHQL